MPIQLLDENQLAIILGTSARTLQSQRQRGDGIPYIKIGKLVRYDMTDVEKHLRDNRQYSTSDIPQSVEENGDAF